MEKEKSTVASWDCRNQDKGWGVVDVRCGNAVGLFGVVCSY